MTDTYAEALAQQIYALQTECRRLRLERNELIEALDLAVFALDHRDDEDPTLVKLKAFLAKVTK